MLLKFFTLFSNFVLQKDTYFKKTSRLFLLPALKLLRSKCQLLLVTSYIFHQCLSLGFGVYRCGGDSHFSFSQPCCLLWRQLHSSAVAGAGAGRRGDGECWDQLPSAHSWHAAAALRTQLPWQRQTWCSWSRHQWSMFHKLSWSLLPWQTDVVSECINIKFLNQP